MRLAFWLYEGTALHGNSRVTNSMKGVHTVYHAPQGDDYITATYSMLERTPDFPALTLQTPWPIATLRPYFPTDA